MENNTFDHYAKTYNTILRNQLKFFEKDDSYFAKYKAAKLKTLISFQPKSILDFGCGVGRSALFLKNYFPEADIYGCDTSEQSLQEAKKAVPSVNFFLTNALSDKINSFDVVFISNVFHHIDPNERSKVLNFITQSCRTGGKIVVFEHNPYNPITRHLVNTCPFDHDAILLKPKELISLFQCSSIHDIKLEYTLFFPAFLKCFRFLEKYLKHVPLGGQYVVSGNR